ncbi:Dol-P-Man:Man(7)GlcNAc(2)-PP-Dol alpha-1,6-mannosyltransferase [Ceratocystis pirilliformis]|uniref:Mannosyltransferase n=1 Tax=Ceratocystis pirilliformis TaxID=259994 RepID=A0ABR3Z1A1_9PEZI
MKLYEWTLPLAVMAHLLAAPYTKVEESFNMQATHDILVYGVPQSFVAERLSAFYDHMSFPGAVPRSFIGSLLLASFSQPLIVLFGFRYAQILVRALLGLANAACLIYYGRRLSVAFGESTGMWYVLLQAAQFHVMFYASRLLPNMFAFGLTTLAFGLLLPDKKGLQSAPRRRLALCLIVFAGVIFRAELAILLATQCFWLLIMDNVQLWSLVKPIAISAIVALVVSMPVDSYFWQKPVWPELWAFYFNVIQGSSSLWGTSPWWYYYVSALPRLLLNPLAATVLAPYALSRPATSRPARAITIPALLFVAIYSLQPHKEARFIIYIVPPLTAIAAMGAAALFDRRAKSLWYTIFAAALCLSVLLSAVASAAMLFVSSLNYPGGDALASLYKLARDDPYAPAKPLVHTNLLSCMTGVTRFGENPRGIPMNEMPMYGLMFDKTEDERLRNNALFWDRFDYILTEVDTTPPGHWDLMAVVRGYEGVEVLKPGMPEDAGYEVVGKGELVSLIREWVRDKTGGWWIGPRMVDKINILRRAPGTQGIWQEP